MTKPVYGMVSWDKSRFTLHNALDGNTSSYTEGYSKDMFDGFSGPVIRNDKANLKDVIESIKGDVIHVEGVDHPSPFNRNMALEEYLEHMKSHNIPVEMGYQE